MKVSSFIKKIVVALNHFSKILSSCVYEWVFQKQVVFFLRYDWDEETQDFMCELMIKGRIQPLPLSKLLDDKKTCELFDEKSKKKIRYLILFKSGVNIS